MNTWPTTPAATVHVESSYVKAPDGLTVHGHPVAAITHGLAAALVRGGSTREAWAGDIAHLLNKATDDAAEGEPGGTYRIKADPTRQFGITEDILIYPIYTDRPEYVALLASEY